MYAAGSMVLVDRSEREMVDGKVYVLVLEGGLAVRRVRHDRGWRFSEGQAGWNAIAEVKEVIGLVKWVSNWLI